MVNQLEDRGRYGTTVTMSYSLHTTREPYMHSSCVRASSAKPSLDKSLYHLRLYQSCINICWHLRDYVHTIRSSTNSCQLYNSVIAFHVKNVKNVKNDGNKMNHCWDPLSETEFHEDVSSRDIPVPYVDYLHPLFSFVDFREEYLYAMKITVQSRSKMYCVFRSEQQAD